jgi:hypothetical protein
MKIVTGFHGDDVSLRPLFDLRAGENVTWAIYSDGYLPMHDGTGKYSTWPQVPGPGRRCPVVGFRSEI